MSANPDAVLPMQVDYITARHTGYTFKFGRVNIILGANGSGKSKFLAEVRDSVSTITGGGKAVYIEGGRAIKIKDVLQVDHSNFNQFDRYESAVVHYENKRTSSLADRLFDALVVLDKSDGKLRAKHSDSVEAWNSQGRKTPYPVRKQPPLEHLFELFNEIFPKITLTYDNDARRLLATKGGISYGPSSLSDGEKQVFSILADLIELEPVHKLIVADEPELNLHPELAERVWTLIENEFPEKRFIYATHSINFALRENVDVIYVLSSNSEDIAVFSDFESLPRAEWSAFLGGLPGILSANKVLVTEGHEKSFDAIFYRWLLEDPRLEIYPGGGCRDVIHIAGKTGLWSKISSRISISGVIDADYRGDNELNEFKSSAIHVLPFHEAESYLCLPEVLHAVAERIGSQESIITADEVKAQILACLASEKLLIAARLVFAQAKVSLAVSVERKLLAAASDREALVQEIRAASAAEIAKAEAISPDSLANLFDTHLSAIDKVISSRDIELALRWMPAKELLSKLAPRAGCKNGTDLMRALRKNFKPSDFPKLATLAVELHQP